tara:strand:+ start:56 stop:1180 length:1125 start_codon:yes stop_codon:yes gene_type:complete
MKTPLKYTGGPDGFVFGQQANTVVTNPDNYVFSQEFGTYMPAGTAQAVASDPQNQMVTGGFSTMFPANSGAAETAGASTSGQDFASNMASPQAMMGVAQGLGGILQGAIGSGRRRKEQLAAQDEYDKIMQQYKDLDTSNLYADVENKYTGMENVYEDLTVNRQQAEFERDMFRQQQANTMQGLSAAAGGSGIAGLAQAMANQGQIAARQAGASIGAQESRINMLRAQEAARLQATERKGESIAEAMRLAGAERARGLEYRQTATQLGMSQQRLAQANMARAQAQAALYGGIGSLAGTAAMAAISDRRLKKNISLIGKSPSGLNIYSFEYINPIHGQGLFQGVMSDEIPFNAVISGNNYDMVDYNMIDVKFKRID